jgi:hypothetical protein
VHRREIVFDPERHVIDVVDLIRCEREHQLRRCWHFAEDCEVETIGQELHVVSGDARVVLQPQEPLDRIEVYRGGNPEQGGWISRRFGHKAPCTTVAWRSGIRGATALRTRIVYSRGASIGV